MSDFLQPKEKKRPTSMRLPSDLLEQFAEIAAELELSRTSVIVQFLRRGLEEHRGSPVERAPEGRAQSIEPMRVAEPTAQQMKVDTMSDDFPELPPPTEKGKTQQMNVRTPLPMFARLGEIAEATGLERKDVVLHFLRWAIRQYDAKNPRAKKPDGKRPEEQPDDRRRERRSDRRSSSGEKPSRG